MKLTKTILTEPHRYKGCFQSSLGSCSIGPQVFLGNADKAATIGRALIASLGDPVVGRKNDKPRPMVAALTTIE
jgi:hypothetical protein